MKWHLAHKGEPVCGIGPWRKGPGLTRTPRWMGRKYQQVDCERCKKSPHYKNRTAKGRWSPDDDTEEDRR